MTFLFFHREQPNTITLASEPDASSLHEHSSKFPFLKQLTSLKERGGVLPCNNNSFQVLANAMGVKGQTNKRTDNINNFFLQPVI